MGDLYLYRTLKSVNEVRLLALQPLGREPEDYIWQGDIREVTFEALSYTWGSERTTVRVSQDGAARYIAASETLAPILNSLRHAHEQRLLWVDALCINQRDVDERNRVVPRMRDIYSHATTVVIGLGPERSFSEFIPHVLLAIHDSLEGYDHLNGFARLDEHLRRILEARSVPGADDADEIAYRWKTLRNWLNDRPWFRRMWVIQEAAVAHKSVVRCAGWQMGGPSFFQTMGMLSRCPLPPSIADVADGFDTGVRTAIQQIGLMRRLGAGKDTVDTSPLMDLLKSSRGAGATDPHDHIYALLGLASDEGLPDVDYAQPWQETYRRFAVYLIEHGSLADILQNCFWDEVGNDDLPTWVPDWSSLQEIFGERSVLSIPYHTPGSNTAGYAAGGQQPARFAWDGGEVLRVRGALTTKIASVGDSYGNPYFGSPSGAAARIVLEALHELYQLAAGMDRGARDLLVWQTLLCGQHWDTNRPLEAPDLRVGYSWVAAHESLLDQTEEEEEERNEPLTGSQRGRQLVGYLAFDEYKVWNQTPPPTPPHEAMRRFERKALDFCVTHRRCTTDAGLVGQVPRAAVVGDVVAVVEGVPVPLVLREVAGAYKIVGPSYFTSMMTGHVIEILADKMGMIPLK